MTWAQILFSQLNISSYISLLNYKTWNINLDWSRLSWKCVLHMQIYLFHRFTQHHYLPFKDIIFYNTVVTLQSQGGSNSIIVCHYKLNKLFKIYQSKISSTGYNVMKKLSSIQLQQKFFLVLIQCLGILLNL